MMKYIIIIAAFFISLQASGQGIYNKVATNIKQNRIMVDSVLGVPRDTTATNLPTFSGNQVGDSGRLAYYMGKFWGHDASGWKSFQYSTDAPVGSWLLTGNSRVNNEFIGTTNNSPFVIKTNNDTSIITWGNGQTGFIPSINNGSAIAYFSNRAIPNGALTNVNINLYKPSRGVTNNPHFTGFNYFPSPDWINIDTDGPVWFTGFNPNEKEGYFSIGARNDNIDVYPSITLNKKFLVGIGRTGTVTGVDATATLHIAPGLDTLAPLKFTDGDLLNTQQKGAIEYSEDKLYFTRNTTRNEFVFKGFTDTITVAASGADYNSLSALFAAEPEGNKLILLTDSVYYELNAQYTIKEGWYIKGQGMGKTIVRFNFDREIDANNDGFQIRNNCILEDIQIQSINNTSSGGDNFYAIHSDVSSPFTAVIKRCHLRTIKSPLAVDASGYNGLVLGVGTGEGQVIEFIDCIIEGQTVSMEDRGVVNTHNTLAASDHVIPSRLTFKNCSILGGFNAFLINDTYSGPESDENRVKDIWEFLGSDIKGGIMFRSSGNKKNGFVFNFSGSSIDEIMYADSIVNTSLSNYNAGSLPMPSTVQYWKNTGASDIFAGDPVSYVYANRNPYWNYSSLISTPIGVEKTTSLNYNNFAGISLTNSVVGKYSHIAMGGVAYTSAAFPDFQVGEVVTFNSSGTFTKSNSGGIGTVVKKKSTDELGILLTPSGAKSPVTLQTATDAGASTNNIVSISGSHNSAYINTIENLALTDAHGIFVNTPNGNPLRLTLGAFNALQVNGGGRTIAGNITDDAVTTLQATNMRSYGSWSTPITTATGNLTLNNTHHTVRVTVAAAVITLPAASSCPGREYVIVNYNTGGNITTTAFLNASAVSTTTIASGGNARLQSDGTNWYKIN